MSKIKNDGLDQCGDEPFEQQQFGTAGVEGVNVLDEGDGVCHIKQIDGDVLLRR